MFPVIVWGISLASRGSVCLILAVAWQAQQGEEGRALICRASKVPGPALGTWQSRPQSPSCPHFMDEDMEGPRAVATCPKSQLKGTEPGFHSQTPWSRVAAGPGPKELGLGGCSLSKRVSQRGAAALGFRVLLWEGPGLATRRPRSNGTLLPPGCATLGQSLPSSGCWSSHFC